MNATKTNAGAGHRRNNMDFMSASECVWSNVARGGAARNTEPVPKEGKLGPTKHRHARLFKPGIVKAGFVSIGEPSTSGRV